VRAFASAMQFPILPCDLCGSQENLQRKQVGRMLDELEVKRPGTKTVMLAALGNVRPSHLLDKRLAATWAAAAGAGEEPEGARVLPVAQLVRS